MDSYSMGMAVGKLVGGLIGGLIGAAVGALLGAFLLMLSTRIVAGFRPPYWQAWRASYLGYAASMVVGFIIGMVFFTSGVTMAGNLLMIPVGFLVQATVYGMVLKDIDDTTIGFGKACLVSVLQVVIALVAAGIVMGVFVFAIKPSLQQAGNSSTGEQQQQQVQQPSSQQQPRQSSRSPMAPPAAATAGASAGAPAPGATPHPAVNSRELAVRLYPGLSVPKSPLNLKFLALYAEARSSNPQLLTQPDWPLVLAERAVISFGGVPEARRGR